MPTDMCEIARALEALPATMVQGAFTNRRYIATKSVFADGKSIKLVAEELGGPDYISCNFYQLARGGQLYPCEMSSEKVAEFILGFKPDHDTA